MDGGGSEVNDRLARTVCGSIGVMIGGHIIAWGDRNGEAASVTSPIHSRTGDQHAVRRSRTAPPTGSSEPPAQILEIWLERSRSRLFRPGDTGCTTS
jgi:hypothetical protein